MSDFLFEMALEKTGDNGALRFRGVASSTALDTSRERMTPQALQKMTQFEGIPLRPTHKGLVELGVVQSANVQGGQYVVEGEFDAGNWEAVKVYEALAKDAAAGRPPRYSLSVGGKVTGASWRFDKEARTNVRCIEDVELDHIAVCWAGKQANPDAWITALAKSADEEWPEPDDLSKEVSTAAWNGKRSDLPKSAYLVEGETWADCKLPVYEPDTSSEKDADGHYTKRGALNANGVRAALAAIGGARSGKAMDVPGTVKDKLAALAAQCGIETELSKEGVLQEAAMNQEPIPVEVVYPGDHPSPVFEENASEENVAVLFEHVANCFWARYAQLERTVKGIMGTPLNGRLALLTKALADFSAAALGDIDESLAKTAEGDAEGAVLEKAGARHSKADIEHLHAARVSLQKADVVVAVACGCAECKGEDMSKEQGALGALNEDIAALKGRLAKTQEAGQ